MLAVLACALLLRLLVPQGWMPVATGHGWRLTPCSGTGPMRMAMPAGTMAGMHHGSDGRDHGGADHDAHACPFASLALAIEEPVLPTLLAPMATLSLLPAASRPGVAIGHGLAAPPPPATGPPHA